MLAIKKLAFENYDDAPDKCAGLATKHESGLLQKIRDNCKTKAAALVAV